MKNKLFCLYILLIMYGPFNSLAQEILFKKIFHIGQYCRGFSISSINNSDFYIACESYNDSVYNFDYTFVKLNSFGDTIWSRTINDSLPQSLRSVSKTSDGNLITCGFTYYNTAGNDDAEVIKFDFAGNVIWRHKYGGTTYDYALKIIETYDSNYIFAGGSNNRMWVVKIDTAGNTIWNKSYALNTTAFSIAQTSDWGFLVVGNVFLGGLDNNKWIIKLDSLGNLKWSKQYGLAYDDEAFDIKSTLDSNYIIAGNASFFVTGQANMLEIDASGNQLINKNAATMDGGVFNSEEVMSDSGFIFVGVVSNAQNYDSWIYRTNNICDSIWSIKIDTLDYDFLYSSNLLSQNIVIACGTSSPINQSFQDLFVVGIRDNAILTGINFTKNISDKIIITPNPADDVVKISILNNEMSSPYSVIIRNYLGDLIMKKEDINFNDQFTLNCKSFPAGVYFLEIIFAKKKLFSKFIIIH